MVGGDTGWLFRLAMLIETNHIVISGWSLQALTRISELALANAYQSDTCIVVLSEEDKVQTDRLASNSNNKASPCGSRTYADPGLE